MVDVTKPVYGDVWANTGEKLAPDSAKIATGWIQEMMPYQYENFLQNRADTAITYLLQKGVAEWSSDQEYIANKSVVTYSSNLYIATVNSTNVLPTVNTSWRKLTVTIGTNGAIPVSFGGTGATTAADARTNLGIGSAGVVDLPVADGLLIKQGSSLVSRTIEGTPNYITVTNGDGQSGNPIINVGANVAKTDTNTSWTSTGSIKLPAGSTSEQGTATPGKIRFNNETGEFHGAYADGWKVLAKPSTASETTIVDSGGYYASANAEGALQEVGKVSLSSVLFYPDYTSASSAAASLPDGQTVETIVSGVVTRYQVSAGSLVPGVVLTVQEAIHAEQAEYSKFVQGLPSAREKGAVLDGVTDDTAALQACLDDNKLYVIDGPARITSDLIVDPIRNRNCGFVSPFLLASRYPTTTQSGGPAWDGAKEARIIYDGPSFPVIVEESVTSVSQVVGNRGFAVSAGLAYVVGQPVTVYRTAEPDLNRMYGTVASYDSATGDLVVAVTGLTGTGTYAGWTIVAYDNHCVIRASAEAVGVEPAATFANTIWGFRLGGGLTLDANGKAGFGLYGVRVQDLQLDLTRFRGATVAGASINGTYSGSARSVRAYLNPGRGIEVGDADWRWGWTAQDKVNAFYMYDVHADANGSGSNFRESNKVRRELNCGVFLGPHRSCHVYGIVSENNFGANVVFAPSDTGNTINGLYTELGCRYIPGGAGTDAISLGYATRQYGLIVRGAVSALHCRATTGALASDYVWLTGVEPSPGRKEAAFELDNIALCPGIVADWSNYRLVDCNQEMVANIIGSQPTGAKTFHGGIRLGASAVFKDYDPTTWIPRLEGSTTPGTGWEFSVQSGERTRIGRLVYVNARITVSAKSADAAGSIVVAGLTDTSKNSNGASAAIAISSAVSLATAVVSLSGTVNPGTNRIALKKRAGASVNEADLTVADVQVGTSFILSGFYPVE